MTYELKIKNNIEIFLSKKITIVMPHDIFFFYKTVFYNIYIYLYYFEKYMSTQISLNNIIRTNLCMYILYI